MVFLDRRLRSDIPEPVAELLVDEKVWSEYAPFDKDIFVIGESGSYRTRGDWFRGKTAKGRPAA